MNNKMKKVMKRSLILMLAMIIAIGAGVGMNDAMLKADEEAPEAEVVIEEAAPVELPVPADEPVIVIQEITFAAEEPVVEETPVIEEPAVEENAPVEEENAEKQDAEAEAETEAEADKEDEAFDVRKAYEKYMSLGSEEEKLAFLESLDSADRTALEEYIAIKEAEAGEQEQVAEAEAEAEAEEQEAPSTVFGSTRVSGEWAGRSTSTARTLNVEVYVDGELADSCCSEMNMSVANFSVAAGGCEIESVSSSCGAFSGSNGSYSVDMYADTFAAVTVELSSPVIEEEVEDSEGNDAPASGMIQLRENPNGLSEIIGEVPEDGEIEVLFVDGDWAYVICGSEAGYAHVSQLGGLAGTDGESAEKERKVTVFSSRKAVVAEGETIYLTSMLEGFEDSTVTYQWQFDRGNGWEDMEGATGAEYSFKASEENLSYNWRLWVHYDTEA